MKLQVMCHELGRVLMSLLDIFSVNNWKGEKFLGI